MNSKLIAAIRHFPQDTGSLTPGLIYASNEARFTSTHYSEALTGYTVGWRDPADLDALLERLFPAVVVGRRFEFKSAKNADAFLTVENDERAINEPFSRLETRGETVLGKTVNRGLTTRVDHDEAFGTDWRERKIAWLLKILLRNEFRRCIAMLDAAATNANKTWDAISNPDGDIRAQLKAGADVSGVRGNIVVFGEAAMDLRLDAYESMDTPYAGRAASMTEADLARKYMVDRVEVVQARYQSTATEKEAIVPSAVYSYLAEVGADKDDPSNFKRFTTPTMQGPRFGVYVEEHPKFTDLSVEHYSSPTVTSTLGVRKSTVAAI